MEHSEGKNPLNPSTYLTPATISSMIKFRKFCVDYASYHLHDDKGNVYNQSLTQFVSLIAHSDQLFARARAVIPELQMPGEQTSSHASPMLHSLLHATLDLRGSADKMWEPLPEEPVWKKHLEQEENKKKTSNDRAQEHPAAVLPPASTQRVGLRADVPEFKPSHAMGGRPVVYSPTSGTRLLRLSDSYEPQATPAPATSLRLAAEFGSLSVQKTRRPLPERPRVQSSGEPSIPTPRPNVSQFYRSPQATRYPTNPGHDIGDIGHAYAETTRYPTNPGHDIDGIGHIQRRGRTRHSHKHIGPWNAPNHTRPDESYAPSSTIPGYNRQYHNSQAPPHPRPFPPNLSPHPPIATRIPTHTPPQSPYPAHPSNPPLFPPHPPHGTNPSFPPPHPQLHIPAPDSLPPFQLWQALYAAESTLNAHLASSDLPMLPWHHGTLAYLQEMRVGAAASQIPPRGRSGLEQWLEVLRREYRDVWRVKVGERRRTQSVLARKRDYEMAVQREIENVQQTEGRG